MPFYATLVIIIQERKKMTHPGISKRIGFSGTGQEKTTRRFPNSRLCPLASRRRGRGVLGFIMLDVYSLDKAAFFS